jgi:transglutaminase-like putative cysteine protease
VLATRAEFLGKVFHDEGITFDHAHRWAAGWWVGDWWAYNPTNDAVPGTGHVVIARGRDYGYVTPVRGIYHGGDGGSADVTVEVTRLR